MRTACSTHKADQNDVNECDLKERERRKSCKNSAAVHEWIVCTLL